jgi:EAL domain-containing protein (putative c-di-GMP-specific phosphodiesterase class I)
MAMYRAKEAGRNAFRFFDADMNSAVVEHLHLISGMRAAPSRDEFMLHYQPQFDLRSGRIIGAEALIRWRHPELGLIPPAKFIPVAEKTGLIIEIGEWVIREACRQAAIWRKTGLGELMVSVNLSPVQFRRDNVERLVLNALDETGLPPGGLELELTESLLIEDSTHLTDMLRRLRQLGVSFSIDDFGTGYSNLGYLKRFEVERLKIDQSFVRRLTEDPHDEAIVRAISQMANSLGLMTVAEGVETEATLLRLQQLGCDRGQGYYWSPALAPDDFARFVMQHTNDVATS